MAHKVRVGSTYSYDPVPMDRIGPPVGVTQGILAPGDRVKVVNLPGCPKANTMGQCYIETAGGKFAGMCSTNSLMAIERRE